MNTPGRQVSESLATRNIVLVGYRGCGKTSAGRMLATRLNRPFVDTDDLIETEAGCTIREIFAEQGEPAFRTREADIIQRVCATPRQVISVGGGAVLSEDNRQRLGDAGVCVWLTAPADTLVARMRQDPRNAANRPALTNRDAFDEVRHLLTQREPLYAALAQHVVDTAGRSVVEVTEAILTALQAGNASSESR